jgi:hypothetical protein
MLLLHKQGPHVEMATTFGDDGRTSAAENRHRLQSIDGMGRVILMSGHRRGSPA